MTDPVTNVEIEDVLSSIRRLVSENARGQKPAEEPETKAHEPSEPQSETTPTETRIKPSGDVAGSRKPSPDGMLVLTADHRVGGDDADVQGPFEAPPEARVDYESNSNRPEETHHWADDGAETAVEEAAEQTVVETAIEEAARGAVKRAVADMIAEELEAAGEAWIEGDETTGKTDLRPEDAGENGSDSRDGSEEPEDHAPLQFSHSDPDHGEDMSSLAERIAGLETAVAARNDQWEPDGEVDDENAGGPVEALNWEDGEVEAEDTGHIHAWETDELDAAEEAELVADDAPEADPEATAETDLEAVPADPQLAQDIEPDTDMFEETESVIDEDTLREVVAEIVRCELQGSLGERITRNVRKLVRREIHRALAARELE